MTPLRNFIALVGRIFLAYIFVQAGIGKLSAIDATAANMTSHGIPLSNILVWGAVVLEIGGGLLLMTGLFARGAGFGDLHARLGAHFPPLLAGAGRGRERAAHHLLQPCCDHRRHALCCGVRRGRLQPRRAAGAARLGSRVSRAATVAMVKHSCVPPRY